MKSSKIKYNKLIVRLKFKAFELHKEGQLPTLLYTQICKCDTQTSQQKYMYLSLLCEQFMRVKGFYIRYRQYEDTFNCEIRKDLIDKGYYKD